MRFHDDHKVLCKAERSDRSKEQTAADDPTFPTKLTCSHAMHGNKAPSGSGSRCPLTNKVFGPFVVPWGRSSRQKILLTVNGQKLGSLAQGQVPHKVQLIQLRIRTKYKKPRDQLDSRGKRPLGQLAHQSGTSHRAGLGRLVLVGPEGENVLHVGGSMRLSFGYRDITRHSAFTK